MHAHKKKKKKTKAGGRACKAKQSKTKQGKGYANRSMGMQRPGCRVGRAVSKCKFWGKNELFAGTDRQVGS